MTDTAKAIAKIHEFERFGSILGLERMTRLLEILGNPHRDLKVIHVAGTNGKGSVCRYIYRILQESGYRTGLYTSPFLEVFNERIELDDKLISDEDLTVYTDRVLAAAKVMTDRGEQSPTEFEVVTAIAFLYYKEKAADYVVLEVGLGGTGDSTNVCDEPLMTVITSVSMDHMDRLGDTIEEIAAEKAGILKAGCPLVMGVKDQRALKVIEDTAASLGAMAFRTKDVPVMVKEETVTGSRFSVNISGVEFEDVEISMTGRHQIENAVVALAAVNLMEMQGHIHVPREALYKGLKKASQPGRFEIISRCDEEPIIIIDGAHNEDGARALKEAVNTLCPGKKILMVTGMLADKDVDSIISQFMEITEDFIVTEPDNPRKMSASELAQRLQTKGANCQISAEAEEACKLAEKEAKKSDYDAVIFAGSLYLIGKIRSILRR